MRTVRFFISNEIPSSFEHLPIAQYWPVGSPYLPTILLIWVSWTERFPNLQSISFFVQISIAEENSRWSLVDLIAWVEGHILLEALDTYHLNCSCPCIITIEDLCQAG